MTNTLDPAETMMVKWLDERGYPWEFEPLDWPDERIRRRPDFRVHCHGLTVAIEVESIESWGGFEKLRAGPLPSRPIREPLRILRNKIAKGARQLKPLARLGLPLVVAVANPLNRPVPFSPAMLIAAMYGDPAYGFPPEGGPGQAVLGRNGKLTNDHRYLSAILLLRLHAGVKDAASAWFDENRAHFSTGAAMSAEARRLEQEGFFGDPDAVAIDLIETVGTAPRLPSDFASGPNDTRHGPLPDGSGLQRLT
jgi:hypothetical protein